MPIIGIDIGTSSCSVAMMIDGQPQVLPVFDGRDEMPTYVAFTPDGERLIGMSAKRQSVMNPANTIFTIKRLIGRKFASEATQDELGLLPYQVTASGSGGLWVQAGGRTYTPTEITAMMLTEVRRATEVYLGVPVTQAVITVPAYFDETQIRATKVAAQIAGFEVLRYIAEPTSAAMAYGMGIGLNKSKTVAVYDLGGGTFDISILEIGDGVFEVKAVNGDNRLGGEDFDHKLVRHFVEEINRTKGLNLSNDPLALHRIKDAAEQIKIQLDTVQAASITLPYLVPQNGQFLHVELKLTRNTLIDLVGDLIDRTLVPCRQALKDAGVIREELSAVVLVGGMSRMPIVKERVGEFFGRVIETHIDPSRIVALGVAIQAGVLTGDVKDVLLLDVIPLSFGIAGSDGSFIRFLDRNTHAPTKKTQKFKIASPCSDNEQKPTLSAPPPSRLLEIPEPELKSILAPLRIYQGEMEIAADNLLLGELEFDLDVASFVNSPVFEVIFEVDANFILNVTIKNCVTKQDVTHRILVAFDPFPSHEGASTPRASVETEARLAAIRAQADDLINTVDAALRAHRRLIRSDILSAIETARKNLQQAMESRDVDELNGALTAFAAANNMSPPQRETITQPKAVEVKSATTDSTVFISYSRLDRRWLDRLRTHLAPLERSGRIEIWHDGKIECGVSWRQEIDSAINKAVAAVLLVSANFMASDFIYENELPPILKRREAMGLRIYPVVIGHVFYQRDKALSLLNAFNDPKRPLSALSDADAEAELARLTGLIWDILETSNLRN